VSEIGTGPEKGVVIVDGGLAATRIAEQLRKAEYAGPERLAHYEIFHRLMIAPILTST